ncbi:hypothetical protein CPC08DRAFT_711928 [Agrocybe pediades]|nr:hypothetical protein CPC08DRAFT_711928 [Agrocybe pediades]
MTLTVDGTISTWTRNGKEWKFTKLIAVPDVSGMAAKNEKPCLAYAKDQIAVSTQTGVKVWLVIDGIWRPQRDITRSGVTAIRFVQDGKALVGGCKDSVLWYCEVPNGALRVYAFLPKPIHSIDIHPSGTYLLVGVEDGLHLLTLKSNENTGKIEQSYKSEKALAQMGKRKGFPAVFATRGQAILYGMINDCALVWDRRKGSIVYGLKHPNGDHVLAAATYDGRPGVEGLMITGTKQGRLFWWPQPVAQANANTAAQSGSGSGTPNDSIRKRAARP